MTEDSNVRVSSSNEASQTRQRKKRKWDQPEESLLPAGMAVPGVLPLSNSVPHGGVVFPGVTSAISGALLTNPLAAAALLQQQSTVAAQKLNQIQDELVIAREIVINDAESSIRYKLTKRQTQEEIQRCTGTIVITRGKYRPPNVPLDGEKPLYLHISAGAHIKDTAERILVVDRAAAMIEEILRPGQTSQSISSASPSPLANGLKVLSTSVFLGFDADPSWNIVARIRGPNDQYINHITNETGATVILRGRVSGNDEGSTGEDGQQPMHLFLSSDNAKSLEQAKSLAENLLDTISMECGASRISSCKAYSAVPPPQPVYTAVPPPQPVYTAVPSPQQVYSGPTAILPLQQGYSAVPPPQQLLAGVQSLAASSGITTTSLSLTAVSTPIPLANTIGYTPSLVSGGTSYIGYGGIYPQATPLQQVALALRHSPPVASTVAPTTSGSSRESKSTTSSDHEKEDKWPSLRRKFQELPVVSKGTRHNQGAATMDIDLPDGILSFIFSKLTLKDLIKTCTLSKHWLQEWRLSSRHLNFDFHNTFHCNTLPKHFPTLQSQSQFTAALDQSISNYQHPTIDSIRVQFPLGDQHSDVIDRLISLGIAKGVKHIQLLFSDDDDDDFIDKIERYRFSFTLLSLSTTLTYLHLQNCHLLEPMEFCGLKNLTTLVLQITRVDQVFIQGLFSNCLHLLDLTLHKCVLYSPITIGGPNFKIGSSKLRHLKIIDCRYGSVSPSKISIVANNLSSFEYSGHGTRKFAIMAPKLSKVFWNAAVNERNRNSLGSIPKLNQIENLVIITTHSHISRLKALSRIRKLKQLELFIDKGHFPYIDFYSILDVLMATQHLQKLSLTVRYKSWNGFLVPRKTAKFFHNGLEFVELHGCVCNSQTIVFARMLLRNVNSLKKITFSSCDKFYTGAGGYTASSDNNGFNRNFIFESLKDEVKEHCQLVIL
ncbi:uncharacterized protein LOC131601214 isoform X2 [Vicia villosa]|uniref:uncharacterized protein LOC131601214 isoform X2 n=1 Tax=Vicia villosa TaxID=3911 RepID=UPI00273AD42D|nr:uncharacterized protein LOC131601214 isoform X2 [Vicia villosa]